MAAVDYPFYFDLEEGTSLLEPLPFDSNEDEASSSSSDHHNDDITAAGLEFSLSQIVLEELPPTPSLPLPTISTNCNSTKRRPRVSFQEAPTFIAVPSFACFPEDERRGLWYRPNEIERFRSSARDACRRLREDPAAFPEDVTRGLELRTSLDRQWRKHLARNCILKAQCKFGPDALQLATVAERCTALPREEALTQATRDYWAVYHPEWMTTDTTTDSSFSSTVAVFETEQEVSTEMPLPLPITQPEQPVVPTFTSTDSLLEQPLLWNPPLHQQLYAEEYVPTLKESSVQQQQQKHSSIQKKRPSLDLDPEEEDSSSSSSPESSPVPDEEDDELRIHDRITKRYRCTNAIEEEECLFADLDFEIDL